MDLYINLNDQNSQKKNKKTYMVLSILTFLFSFFWVAFNINEMSAFAWFNTVYYFLIAILLYRLGIGKPPFDLIGKAYFKINDTGVIYKSSVIRKKIVQYNWNEIEDIKIKLFEVELKINNKWISIDLEKLSDDNLKSVKEVFKNFQASLATREISVA